MRLHFKPILSVFISYFFKFFPILSLFYVYFMSLLGEKMPHIPLPRQKAKNWYLNNDDRRSI